MHSAEGFTHDRWWQSKSVSSLIKTAEMRDKGDGPGSRLLASSTRHWDEMYISSFYNWRASSWKAAYGYKATYKLKPNAPRRRCRAGAQRLLLPVFEKMLADGTIVEYEIGREMIHTTDSRPRIVFSFVMPNAEGLDKFRATLGAALDENSLIAPAFGSMMANFTPKAGFVKVNAAYN